MLCLFQIVEIFQCKATEFDFWQTKGTIEVYEQSCKSLWLADSRFIFLHNISVSNCFFSNEATEIHLILFQLLFLLFYDTESHFYKKPHLKAARKVIVKSFPPIFIKLYCSHQVKNPSNQPFLQFPLASFQFQFTCYTFSWSF